MKLRLLPALLVLGLLLAACGSDADDPVADPAGEAAGETPTAEPVPTEPAATDERTVTIVNDERPIDAAEVADAQPTRRPLDNQLAGGLKGEALGSEQCLPSGRELGNEWVVAFE